MPDRRPFDFLDELLHPTEADQQKLRQLLGDTEEDLRKLAELIGDTEEQDRLLAETLRARGVLDLPALPFDQEHPSGWKPSHR